MLKLGYNSIQIYNTLHKDLKAVISVYLELGKTDLSLIEGLRLDSTQLQYFKEGLSECDGINRKSKHQANKDGISEAFDFCVYTSQKKFKNKVRYDYSHLARVAGSLEAIAHVLYVEGKITHKIRWGGDWDFDGIVGMDHKLKDLCHIELYKP